MIYLNRYAKLAFQSPSRGQVERKGEAGAVTAELAIALPTLVMLLLFSLTMLTQQRQQLETESDLVQYARALARNESEGAVRAWFAKRHPTLHVIKTHSSGALCLSVKFKSAVSTHQLKHCIWLGDL